MTLTIANLWCMRNYHSVQWPSRSRCLNIMKPLSWPDHYQLVLDSQGYLPSRRGESIRRSCCRRFINLDGFLNVLGGFPESMAGNYVEAPTSLCYQEVRRTTDTIAPAHLIPASIWQRLKSSLVYRGLLVDEAVWETARTGGNRSLMKFQNMQGPINGPMQWHWKSIFSLPPLSAVRIGTALPDGM